MFAPVLPVAQPAPAARPLISQLKPAVQYQNTQHSGDCVTDNKQIRVPVKKAAQIRADQYLEWLLPLRKKKKEKKTIGTNFTRLTVSQRFTELYGKPLRAPTPFCLPI